MNRFYRAGIHTLVWSSFVCLSILAKDTEINDVKQHGPQGVPSYFSRPLEYSRSSLTFFLKNVYNDCNYPQFLALDFTHVNQGLRLAPQNPFPRRFMRKLLGLFSVRLYNVYVNPYAFETCLTDMIDACAPYTDVDQERDVLITQFKEMIGSCLSDNFDQLRQDPEVMLQGLAMRLFELTQSTPDKDIAVPDLQYAIDHFLSQAVRLLVWSPKDQSESWHSLQRIAGLLYKAAEKDLIDYDMLDKMYWTLIYQYAHFLGIAGHLLDDSFFETASASLSTDTKAFWHLEECELYITPKYEYLKNALMQAETASRLYAEGYLR